MIAAQRLSKRIKNVVIFRDLSFVFPDCGLVGVYGNNGSGKTTLLLILDLLDSTFEGDLLINGENVKNLSKRETDCLRGESLLYVGPHGDFLEGLTLKENFALFSIQCPFAFADRKPSEISGGEYQKATLEFIRQVKQHIVLLDEGTAFLDEKAAKDYFYSLKEMSKEKLIIFASPKPLPVIADQNINLDSYHA
jgi:ABC-type lipoprotein export system ATPase subunit